MSSSVTVREALRSGLLEPGEDVATLCVIGRVHLSPSSDAVVKFMDVYRRSYCRPIETLVDIFQEYPDEIEYIFKPSCVPLMRCAGCCNDESLECVPTEEFNITMQVGTCGGWGQGQSGPGPILGAQKRRQGEEACTGWGTCFP